MISHAYLKDSAAQIRACISTPVADPRTTVQEALRRAGLENRDIQLVETQGKMAVSNTELGFPSGRNSADVLNKVSAGVDSLKDFGMTGLVGLCRLGEHMIEPSARETPANIDST